MSYLCERVPAVGKQFFEAGGKIIKQDDTIEVSSKRPKERKAGTEPVIVMAPVDTRICFWFHNRWVCLALNPLHWVSPL